MMSYFIGIINFTPNKSISWKQKKKNYSSVVIIVETSSVFVLGDFCDSFSKENEKMYWICVLQDDVPEVQEFFLVNLTSVELIMNHSTSSPPRLGKTTSTELSLVFLLYEFHEDYVTLAFCHYSNCQVCQYETGYSERNIVEYQTYSLLHLLLTSYFFFKL